MVTFSMTNICWCPPLANLVRTFEHPYFSRVGICPTSNVNYCTSQVLRTCRHLFNNKRDLLHFSGTLIGGVGGQGGQQVPGAQGGQGGQAPTHGGW